MLLIQIKLNHYLCPIVADFMGFSGGLVGKESACNVGDLGSVVQCGRPRFGWEDPLEESMATHSSVLCWRIPKDRGPWRVKVHGITRVGHD